MDSDTLLISRLCVSKLLRPQVKVLGLSRYPINKLVVGKSPSCKNNDVPGALTAWASARASCWLMLAMATRSLSESSGAGDVGGSAIKKLFAKEYKFIFSSAAAARRFGFVSKLGKEKKSAGA